MHEFTLSPLMAQFAGAKAAGYHYALAESLAEPPTLHQFISQLDPAMSLDWSGASFWGLPELRRRVLNQYGYNDPTVTIDNVLITTGCAEAIYLVMAQSLQPGDEVIVETPGWQQPLRVAPALGATVVPWPRHEADAWRLDVEQLERLITPRTRLIYFSNPNNPTGNIANAATLDQIAAVANRHGIRVLSDEVYCGLEWEGGATPHMAEFTPLGVSVGSVSKLFGLQGARIGWTVSHDKRFLENALAMRANTTELINVLGEAIATKALSHENFQIARSRNRAIGRAAVAMLDRIIRNSSALAWRRPQGGFLGFARANFGDGDRLSQALLARPHRLWVIPGSVYGYPQHIRLGLGGNPKQVELALGRLQDALATIAPATFEETLTPTAEE